MDLTFSLSQLYQTITTEDRIGTSWYNDDMKYTGVIIEESLKDAKILNDIIITNTEIEKVTKNHKTPWLKQWTMHTFILSEDSADSFANKVSKNLQNNYWYTDFKNNIYHFIIFPNRIFKVNLSNPTLYKDAKAFGISLGIPPYQVDFAPDDKVWER